LTKSPSDHLIDTTVKVFANSGPFKDKEVPGLDDFKAYVPTVIKNHHACVPMRIILPTLVYLSRAKPIVKYLESQTPLKAMFAAALVVASKVHFPPVLGVRQFSDHVPHRILAIGNRMKQIGFNAPATNTSLMWSR
jgi:hypothetical protein